MPLVQSNPELGYSLGVPENNNWEPPQPKDESGGLIGGILSGAELLNPITFPIALYNHRDILIPAARQYNPIVSAINAITKRGEFPPDPSFDVGAQLKTDGLWDDYRNKFLSVDSKGAYDQLAGRIHQENSDKEILARAGVPGMLIGMGMGLIDPTNLLPFIGEGKGALAVLKSVLLGATAAGIDEAAFRASQVTRTDADSLFSIGAGAVMGGIMGGAAVMVRRGAGESLGQAMDRLGARMGGLPGEEAIHATRIAELEKQLAEVHATPEPSKPSPIVDEKLIAGEGQAAALEISPRQQKISEIQQELDSLKTAANAAKLVDDHLTEALRPGAAVGADILKSRDAGGLAGMLGIGERLTKFAGPVTAALGQRVSKVGRILAGELADAGLRREGNVILDRNGNVIGSVPSNQGGTVESIVNYRLHGELNQVVEEGYAKFSDYRYGGADQGPTLLRKTRGYMAGLLDRAPVIGPRAKLDRRGFFKEVGIAMLNKDVHAIPEVQAVAQRFRQFYDNLYQEAQDSGVIPKDLELLGDPSFLNRMYDLNAIARNPNTFLRLLTEHMNEQLQGDLAKIHQGFQHAQAKDQRRIDYATMPPEEAKALRDSAQKELKALNELDDGLTGVDDLVNLFRTEAVGRSKQINELQRALANSGMSAGDRAEAKAKLTTLTSERQGFRDEITNLQAQGGPDLEARVARRAELKSQLRNLNRNRYFVEAKARAKFDKIDQLEEDNIDSLHRVIGAGNRALKATDKVGADFDKELTNLEAAVKDAHGRAQRYEDQVNALHEKSHRAAETAVSPGEVDPVEEVLAKVWEKEQKAAGAVDKFNEATNNFEAFHNIERVEGGQAEARQAIQDTLDAAVERANAAITKRAQRMAKLEKGAKEKFDQSAWDQRITDTKTRMTERRQKNMERLQEMGADDAGAGLDTGKTTFKQRADEIAQGAMNRIMRTNVRLPGFEMVADKRGTEMLRALSISGERFAPYGFIDTDAEKAIEKYAHTLVPDIEITKRLGPLAPDGTLNVKFKELAEEEVDVIRAHEDAVRHPRDKKTGELLPPPQVDEKKLGDELQRLKNEFTQLRDNITSIISSIRGTYGIPLDPNSYTSRGVTVVRGLLSLAYLGGVVGHSLMDLGKPLARYGLLRTMRSAWLPMVSNWKAVAASAEETIKLGVMVETMKSYRSRQLVDLLVQSQRKSKFEAGLEWTVSKLPLIAGFGPWTDFNKLISNMALTDKIVTALDHVINGTGRVNRLAHEPRSQMAESTSFLAAQGWDDDMQRRIWKEIQNGGAENMRGVWVTQTDNWVDRDAVKSFGAAVNNESAASIVTPGVELPKWMRATTTGKILGSLKSFAMASTSKTLMAALQQRDMGVANAIWISLALGGLSVYLSAKAAGGKTEAAMNSWSEQEWAQRAIDASGLLGAISLATQLASDATAGPSGGELPWQQALKAGRHAIGAYEVRDPGGALASDLGGPMLDMVQLALQAASAKGMSPAEIHRIRRLVPWQNLTGIRRIFDAIENSVGGDR